MSDFRFDPSALEARVRSAGSAATAAAGVRRLQDDRYPDFPWDEFMNQYREGANETMNQINQIMNDPRTWILILQGVAGGAGAPEGVRP